MIRSYTENRTVPPADGIARNRGNSAPFLPSPLAALTACRYRAAGSHLVLRHGLTRRDGLEPLRALLNTATTVEVVTDARGTETFANGTDCGDPGRVVQVTELDTVWVADVTGAVTEVRIRRAPCQAVHRAGRGGLVPKPELLQRLDAWLSP
ncbi:hypothetical protein AB0F17_03710 [Nonomuraea sp. NPDC026600]|uniref:hypothetical protein n=1 Tax=Nonomuraea sp. NPDC026600 TaxID=3155363 RepID=UPI0033F7AD6B